MLAHTHTRVHTQTSKTLTYAARFYIRTSLEHVISRRIRSGCGSTYKKIYLKEKQVPTNVSLEYLRCEVHEIMEEIEDENIEKRDIYGDNGTVVVNEGDNEDEEMNYALEHIDLGREDLVELVNDAMTV